MALEEIDIVVGRPVDINLVCHSPHVVTYRMWQRVNSAGPWKVVSEGHTSDDIPDHAIVGPGPEGYRYAYYMIVVGNASSHFLVSVTLSQDGKTLQSGSFVEQGVLAGTRRVVRERQVVFV